MPSRSDRGYRAGVLATLPLWAALSWGCEGLDQPPATVQVADSADHVVYGVTHYLTADGIRRLRLEADSVYVYEGPQTHQLFGPTVTFFSSAGVETSRVTALDGVYYWRTGNMEARGDVIAVTPDGRRLTTSVLTYDHRTNQIEGSEPFVFVNAEQRIEGEAFTSDPDFRNVVTTRARGAVGRVDVERGQ